PARPPCRSSTSGRSAARSRWRPSRPTSPSTSPMPARMSRPSHRAWSSARLASSRSSIAVSSGTAGAGGSIAWRWLIESCCAWRSGSCGTNQKRRPRWSSTRRSSWHAASAPRMPSASSTACSMRYGASSRPAGPTGRHRRIDTYMANEREQAAQRQAKLQELVERGVAPYPNRFDRTIDVTTLVEQYGHQTADQLEAERPVHRVAGRILGVRSLGKARFFVISDGRTRVQVYVRSDSIDELGFDIAQRLDFGDVIGVEGRVFRTRTNELTLWASSLVLLVKCLLPLPEKWHGLTDIEVRYRQRYLDLIV